MTSLFLSHMVILLPPQVLLQRCLTLHSFFSYSLFLLVSVSLVILLCQQLSEPHLQPQLPLQNSVAIFTPPVPVKCLHTDTPSSLYVLQICVQFCPKDSCTLNSSLVLNSYWYFLNISHLYFLPFPIMPPTLLFSCSENSKCNNFKLVLFICVFKCDTTQNAQILYSILIMHPYLFLNHSQVKIFTVIILLPILILTWGYFPV